MLPATDMMDHVYEMLIRDAEVHEEELTRDERAAAAEQYEQASAVEEATFDYLYQDMSPDPGTIHPPSGVQ